MIVRSYVRGKRFGLTLIEMLVVLGILVALAALLVPRLGGIKAQADNAGAASGNADVMNNLEAYKTTVGSYPRRMDSLLESGSTLLPSLWSHPGPGGAGFEAGDVTGDLYHKSLGHAFGSGLTVSDHTASAADPSNSGATDRTISTSSSSSSNKWALVTDSAVIQAAGYPNGTVPDGVKLVALGVGPRCGAVGKTMASVPRCPSSEADEYGRFIAVFALYASGQPATLQTVIDARRQSIDARVASYKQAAPVQE